MREFIRSIGRSLVGIVEGRYESFVEFAPYIMGALAMFVFGLILAELAGRGIIRISERIKLELIAEKIGLKHILDRTRAKMSPSHVIAKSVKAYLIFLFFIEATKIAQMTEVAEFLTAMIGYVPDLIIALFIVVVGVRLGNTMEVIIKTSLSFTKSTTGNALGIAAKYTVVAFSALAALSQLQIAEILINILFVGFVSMLTIAGGLALGLGGKDVVRDLLEAIRKVDIKVPKKRSPQKRAKA